MSQNDSTPTGWTKQFIISVHFFRFKMYPGSINCYKHKPSVRPYYGLKDIPHVNILGSEDPLEHTGILSFTIDDVHPHDISEILASDKIAVRSGHHCAQPLLTHLGVSSSARASFMFYNTVEEVDGHFSYI